MESKAIFTYSNITRKPVFIIDDIEYGISNYISDKDMSILKKNRNKPVTIAYSKQAGDSIRFIKIVNTEGGSNEVSGKKYENKTVVIEGDATSPYNFVELNKDIIVPSEFESSKDLPPFDSFDGDLQHGYIELSLATKTAAFVHNEEGKMLLDEQHRPVISGSTLRGLLRNMVQIASWGKFELGEDEKLYYREVASSKNEVKGSLSNIYKDKIGDDGNGQNKGKAGFLYYENDNYWIYSVENNYEKIVGADSRPYHYKCNSASCEVFTWMHRKENHYEIYFPDVNKDKNIIQLSDLSIKEYKNDTDRNASINLLECAKEKKIIWWKKIKGKEPEKIEIPLGEENKFGIPVFYTEDVIPVRQENGEEKDEKIHLFGHTRNFRILHTYSMQQAIPGRHKDFNQLDMVAAMFGVLDKHKTRLDVGQAFTNDPDAFEPEGHYPKILSSPKATSYQMYLEQKPLGKDTKKKNLKHWSNHDITVRGNKLYWHRDTTKEIKFKWWDEIDEPSPSHFQYKIRPVNPGVEFTFKVYYENLTRVELGALLFVLDLPGENFCHKIGLGKPLGLGSVKIKVNRLMKIDRVKRYETLLDDSGSWQLAEIDIREKELETLKSEFESYVLKHILASEPDAASLWDTRRMQQLREMLDWENNTIDKWLEKTAYMPNGHQFWKDRKVLPYPGEVKDTKLPRQ